MTKEQKVVGIGAASGALAMVASVATISRLWPSNADFIDVSSRLTYALQMNAFAVLPLLIGVMIVGNSRFLSEAIDPTLNREDLATQINVRVVNNTLEQTVLFLVAALALSVNLAAPQMGIIRAATIVFIIARIAFWIGYRVHPLYRAFGMAEPVVSTSASSGSPSGRFCATRDAGAIGARKSNGRLVAARMTPPGRERTRQSVLRRRSATVATPIRTACQREVALFAGLAGWAVRSRLIARRSGRCAGGAKQVPVSVSSWRPVKLHSAPAVLPLQAAMA